ncbi:hypothetical protein AWB80_05229 [Caballeronia pedi]|uniref:Uncharacterized protein n=1 Tax=Caballeronia pedi TaxID=1777141 RepID=A0A158CH15_9BURK|nr:hypothetical protein [Caballeronia pedi]SAK81634.1 hypothetical protein AWB80_05229 [Caballeronia pedi]
MADKASARFLISSEAAEEKAELLQQLAGGKNALRLNQALEAVASGCGFDRWRDLVATNARLAAGEANSLGISALMLADDHHVDAETLAARRALQVETVRGVITCSYARAQELVALWALSGSPHDDNTRSSVVDTESEQALEETLNDALFAATQEFGPDESPYVPPSVPSAPVAVSYKKRRSPADEK